MIATPGLRWILTVLFAVIVAYSLYRATRPGDTLWARLIQVLHALMGAAMLAMVWPWGMKVPALAECIAFGLATAWFLLLAVLPGPTLRTSVGGGHPRLHNALHATMMGAMAWMALVMPSAMAPPHGSGGSGGSGSDMADMPGMAMGGSGSGMSMSLHGTPRTVAGVLCAFFVLTALWWLARSFDTARQVDATAATALPEHADSSANGVANVGANDGAYHCAYEAGCHGGMALGMAIMLLNMT